MSQNTFSMAGGVARNPLVRLAKPVTATIGADEHIAIVGPNGSGKSLFVDTLKNIFEGKKEYFKDLAIEHKWNWDIKYPVITINFANSFR